MSRECLVEYNSKVGELAKTKRDKGFLKEVLLSFGFIAKQGY